MYFSLFYLLAWVLLNDSYLHFKRFYRTRTLEKFPPLEYQYDQYQIWNMPRSIKYNIKEILWHRRSHLLRSVTKSILAAFLTVLCLFKPIYNIFIILYIWFYIILTFFIIIAPCKNTIPSLPTFPFSEINRVLVTPNTIPFSNLSCC